MAVHDLLCVLCIAMSAVQGMFVVAHGGGKGSQRECMSWGEVPVSNRYHSV